MKTWFGEQSVICLFEKPYRLLIYSFMLRAPFLMHTSTHFAVALFISIKFVLLTSFTSFAPSASKPEPTSSSCRNV